jgi:hypothetical protein
MSSRPPEPTDSPAPSSGDRDTSDRDTAACPFCHSTDTEPLALFGSQLSTAQYYCRACHTPFERVKYDDHNAK